MVPCPTCGKENYRPPSGILRGKGYCNLACRDVAVRARRVKEADGTAKCARCGEWKLIDDFVKGVSGRPHSYCKPCSSAWFHDRRGTPTERRKEYVPAYRLTDEEKKKNKREANQRAHSARRAAGKVPSRKAIAEMLLEQQSRCAYCRQKLSGYHIDHKTPISRGGSNELSNLHLTCGKCNMVKGTMTHEEFLASKKRPVVDWSNAA